MATNKTLASAQIVLFVNGSAYAPVTDFNWSSDTPTRQIFGIDQMTPFELAPQTAHVSGSISVLRLGSIGGAEGAGFTTPFPDLSRSRYFSILLRNILTDEVLFEARQCSLQSQNWSVPNRGIVSGQLNFIGLAWSNESSRSSSAT
jgi:hypothetical protein